MLMPENPLLDRAWARRGFQLNKMAMSLVDPANRKAFMDDEVQYLSRFDLTQEESAAVLSRDWRQMVCLGGNLFFLLKLTAIQPVPITQVAAAQVEMDHEAFLTERLGYKRDG